MTKETEKLMKQLQQKLADEGISYCVTFAQKGLNPLPVSCCINGSIQELVYMISMSINHISDKSNIPEEVIVLMLLEAAQIKEDVTYDKS